MKRFCASDRVHTATIAHFPYPFLHLSVASPLSFALSHVLWKDHRPTSCLETLTEEREGKRGEQEINKCTYIDTGYIINRHMQNMEQLNS